MDAGQSKQREFTVEAALPADIDAIIALERATEYTPHWRQDAYAEMLLPGDHGGPQDDLRRHLIAAKVKSGRVVGFAVGCVHGGLSDSAILESICVAPRARRKGVGRALCKEVIEWCRSRGALQVGLEVRSQNIGAIALYAGLEFVQAGMRPSYYADPQDDAIVLRMDLS